jgi:NitT/TauT family transport system substrate-binding protein
MIPRHCPLYLFLAVSWTLLLTACTTPQQQETLRIVVLPALDSVPLYVADARGYFKDEGVSVTLIPAATVAEQERLIQGEAADGVISTLLTTMLANGDGIELVTVGYALKATPQFPYTYLLAAGGRGISTLADLQGNAIAVDPRSMEAYTVTRLLQAEGLDDDAINLVAGPPPAERPSALESSALALTVLNDPLATVAQHDGAINVIDDSVHPQYGFSVYAFRRETTEQNRAAVAATLRALARAVGDINSEKRSYYPLLQERNIVPATVAGAVRLPDFPALAVPPASQWEDLLRWAQEQRLVNGPVPYQGSVDATFLP